MGSKFQKSKPGFGISTSNIARVPIFGQNRQLLIFWPKFGEIVQLREYFGSNIVEGVTESRVEAELSWVELGGG